MIEGEQNWNDYVRQKALKQNKVEEPKVYINKKKNKKNKGDNLWQ